MLSVKVLATLLVVLLFISIITFPFVGAGKGIRVIGSMRGDSGNVLILVQNASSNDLYSLTIESFSGNIHWINPPDGWGASEPLGLSSSISMQTDTKPVKSHESMRFNIRMLPSEEPKLKFKWTGYSLDGSEIGKGTFATTNRLIKIEITEEEAIKIVKNWLVANENREPQVLFTPVSLF